MAACIVGAYRWAGLGLTLSVHGACLGVQPLCGEACLGVRLVAPHSTEVGPSGSGLPLGQSME